MMTHLMSPDPICPRYHIMTLVIGARLKNHNKRKVIKNCDKRGKKINKNIKSDKMLGRSAEAAKKCTKRWQLLVMAVGTKLMSLIILAMI